ncbi:YSIRK-type signal peptide-containing protein [Limosilactobacillus sp. STM2_1]|uniref:YSIRK-type signal peptide-containing protein n=1 Tax=Limosilactobacillus rudii TaxID=2759755 RepID=A0A7W3UMK0_9LACO|nr:YSIRK-type signal peptide-containing protein [Limosilactobacillus rudii]MBB1079594.1 YSIRK-type signal peptide-containing protein [Limosilactobacillus rudii]MBB1097640.1 YSIRK-type signal peptide-containing protein [Limosilactobacillus rudii]MCD7134749.1 YSIRK-type signal peptide-containing protein [Limosilactobacillus rudii]
MLSHNNREEQFKKYEPKKQRYTIKKLSVGVASVLLGITFANGVSADTTDANANADSAGSDSAEQTDHNLVLNSASASTLKEATAANQANSASAAVQNPAGDIKTPQANTYEATVSAAVANELQENSSATSQSTSADQPTSNAQSTSTVADQSAVNSTASQSVQTQSFDVAQASANAANIDYANVFTSLLASTSNTSDAAVNISTYQPNFNIQNQSNYSSDYSFLPSTQRGYQQWRDGSTILTFATDANDPGQNIYFYVNGRLKATSVAGASTGGWSGSVNISRTNGDNNIAGRYNASQQVITIGKYKYTRVTLTSADGKKVVNIPTTGAFTTGGQNLVPLHVGDSPMAQQHWNSGGGITPGKAQQTIWYVDANTGEVMAHKSSGQVFAGQSYDVSNDGPDKITYDGKSYEKVDKSKATNAALNAVLTTNNGIDIKVKDVIDTPLTGTLGSYRMGDISVGNTDYGPSRVYIAQQIDNDGTISLNTYDTQPSDLGGMDYKFVAGISPQSLASGETAQGASSAYYNAHTPGNRDIVFLYAEKQNATISFIDDDTGKSLSPTQNASGNAGSQISFTGAANTVSGILQDGYTYVQTSGNGVIGGNTGSYNSVNFPVYDNDNNTTQSFVVHFKKASTPTTNTYKQGNTETKTIYRTINYYDKLTGQKIPSDLITTNPVKDEVTFTRTKVLDQNGKVVGYGTVSNDGKSFKSQDWHTEYGEPSTQFDAKRSQDLSAYNYTAPEFNDGTSANIVDAHEVTPETGDLVYNVYYGHKTEPVKTTENVIRHFHYIFTDGTTPSSHLTPQTDQTVTFNGTATKDLVTGQTGPTTWNPSTGTLAYVAGQQVPGYTLVGYVNANADGSASAVPVDPTSSDIDVTLVYTPNAKPVETKQQAKVVIYDKTDNNKELTHFNNDSGKAGDAISFDGEPETLQGFLNAGYKFDSAVNDNGNTIASNANNINFGNFDNVDGNVQGFKIYLVHGTKDTTEKATTNAHVHYVIAGNDANKPAAPADSPLQTINWTRTNTTDLVNGNVTEGNWTPDKGSFTSVTSPTVENYTPDQQVANFTTPQPNRDQLVTVVYSKNPETTQKADLIVYDKTDNNKQLNNFDNSGKTGTQISFSGAANYVADLISKGYKIDSFVNDHNQTAYPTSYGEIIYDNFDNNAASDQHFKLYLVHDTENTTENKNTTSTVHYVVSDGQATPPADHVETISWTRPVTKDKVTGTTTSTGNWTTPGHYNNVPTPNLEGYTPDRNNVPAPTPNPNENPRTVVTYNPKTPEAPTYTGTTETKQVTRTINYYDRVTGERIPASLANTNVQTVTLSRTHVVSSTGQDMGYGTVSADGKTFTKATTTDGWNTGNWTNVVSPDLTNAGYTAPDKSAVADQTVDSTTNDQNVNVYYGHQTVVVTPNDPHNPGGNINPNDPRNNPSTYPDGLTRNDLQQQVTRTVHYVGVNEDGSTTPVNGAPDGNNTYKQKVNFERHAVVDRVTGNILGYTTDNTANIATTDASRAWLPATQTMGSVDSKAPSEVGFDNVDVKTVGSMTVYPGQQIADVTVTYTKNKTPEVNQNADLKIIDRNDPQNQVVLAGYSINDKPGTQITFSGSQSALDNYLKQGYTFDGTSGNMTGNETQGFVYPTLDNDASSDQHFVIYLNHGTENKIETATANAHVHYIVADGGVQAPADSTTQTINWSRTNTVDKVNGKTVAEGQWTQTKPSFDDVKSPELKGYTPSQANVQFATPVRNQNQIVNVVYNKNQAEKANLHIIDISDGNKEINQFHASGDDNTAVTFNGAQPTVDALVKAGYKVTEIAQATSDPKNPTKYSTDYATASSQWTFDDKPGVDQEFYVFLQHDYTPINPTNAFGRNDLTREVTETVHYVNEETGQPVATDYTNKATFTGQGMVDKVTGKMVAIKSVENGQITYDYDVAKEINIADAKESDFAWSEPTTFNKVTSPIINGYTIDAAKTTPSDLADGNDIKEITNVTYNHGNVEATVYYKANPAEIHKAELVIYANGSQVGSASATGAKDTAINFGNADQIVDSYINNGWTFDHAQDVTNNTEMSGKSYGELNFGNYATQNNSNQKFAIYLTKAAEPTQQTAQLIINDVTPGQEMQMGSYTQPGREGSAISFDGASSQVADLLNKGYVWDSSTYNGNNLDAKNYSDIQFGNYDNTDDKSGISQKWVINLVHGYNPVDPDHPDDKDGYTKEYLDRTITRDVTYVDEQGQEMPGLTPEHQETNFKGSGYLDKVTNRWVTVNNGKITGLANGLTWTPDSDQTFDAINAKTADGYHVASVSGNGINGFTIAQDGAVSAQTVNRNSANSTIKVVYAQNPVIEQGNLVVTFHDVTDNKDLTGVGIMTADQNVGTAVTYSPSADLTKLENEGYVYVSTEGNLPSSIVKGTSKVVINVKHGTVPVNPDNPGNPGDKINPNDPRPDGPKYPNGTDKTSIDKTITRTIHYVGADQYTPEDVQQPVNFTAHGVLDKVTGEWETPLTWSANQTFGAKNTPNIPGYHVVSVDKDTTDNKNVNSASISHTGSDYTVTVTYAKDQAPTPDTTTGRVAYIDDTTKTTLKSDNLSGDVGTQINYTTQDKINTYLNEGYKLVSNNFTDGTEVFNKDANKNIFEVHLVHDTVPVNPANPGQPGDKINPNDPRPDGPKYPNGTTETDLTKMITRTIQYTGAGEYTPEAVQQPVNFTAKGVLDKVTGEWVTPLTWSADQSFGAKKTPLIPGYHVVSVDKDTTDNKNVNSATISHTGADYTVTVTYAKDAAPTPEMQNAVVIYQDVNDPANPVELLRSNNLTGENGAKINYSTADEIANLEKEGYVLISNGFDPDGVAPSFDNDTSTNQTFYVKLKHSITPVTPDTPGNPGDKINPNDPRPDGPKYPAGTAKTDLTKTVTRTVTYEGAGSQTPSPVSDTLTFNGTGYLDKVTGKWTDANGHELANQNNGITWTVADGTKDEGSFSLVPTKAINGYTSTVMTVGADDGNGNVKSYTGINHATQNINVVVRYSPVVAEQGNVIVNFHDDTDNVNIPGVGIDTGNQDVGTTVTYSSNNDLTKLENQGYVYVSTDGNIPASIVKGTTTVTIHVKHGTVPVNPDNPGQPGDKINPNDPRPDGPKYPNGTDKASIDKTITRTIHYVGADQYTPSDVQQPVNFTAKGVLDKVTGKWVTPLTWSADQTFGAKNTPNIPGYHVVSVDRDANGTNVANAPISHTGENYTVTVTYAKDQAPVSEKATLHIIDISDNNKSLGTYEASGDDNAAINFNGADVSISSLLRGGYKVNSIKHTAQSGVITDGGADADYSSIASQWKFDDQPGFDQDFYVYLEHDTTPINPTNAYGRNDLTREVTETVHYVDSATNKPVATDYTNKATFTAQGMVDKVTGKMLAIKSVENGHVTYDPDVNKQINITDAKDSDFVWSSPATFAKVTSPTINGYTIDAAKTTPSDLADGNDIKAINDVAYNHGNVEATVYYKANPVTPVTPVVYGNADLKIVDRYNPQAEATLANFEMNNAKTGTQIQFTDSNSILNNYLNNGYKFAGTSGNMTGDITSGFTYPSITKDAQHFVIYLTHDIADQTETRSANAHVHYIIADGAVQAPADSANQTITWTRTNSVDKATGKIVNEGAWTQSKQNFADVKSPEVKGYTPAVENVQFATPVQNQNQVVNVVYTKTPEVPVTPEVANGSITYIDDTTGQTLESASFGGNVGSKINYTTADRIANYEGKGYELVSNNFKDGNETFVKGDNKFEVHLKHATTPVNPDHPGAGYTKTDLDKTITRTVKYQYSDGSQAHTPVEQSVNFIGHGIVDKVTGQLVTVDDNGNITGAGKITWNYDSQDFGQVPGVDTTGYYISGISKNNTNASVDEKTGVVSGKTVTPNSQNSTVVITLTKENTPVTPVTPATVQGQVTYIDDTTGATLTNDGFSGKVGDQITYTTAGKINSYVNQGYELVSNNFKDGNETFAQSGNNFEVHLKHTTTTVTPDNPDPSHGYTRDSLTKTGTQTVVYVGAGDHTPANNVTTVEFGHSLVIDNVTGKVVTDNGWTPASQTYTKVDTPNVDGYTPDKTTVGGETVTVDHQTGNGNIDRTYVVTYTKNETPVTPVTPAKEDGSITVTVHDVTTNQDLPEYGKTSGTQEVGTKFSYDKTTTITDLQNKGYKVINPEVTIPGEVAKGNQNVTIYVEHTTTPVTPDNPGRPGQPINPNDPNGPKFPEGSDQVTKSVTRTITYVDNNGNNLREPVKQTANFTGTGLIDNVTGKWVTPITWSGNGDLAGQTTPVIDGYHVTNVSRDGDGNNVAKVTVNRGDSDYTVVVTYTPNGKIMPVDPSGNPIPNVPTPQYPTDPENPAKVTPNEPVPDVPGFVPSVPSVTPSEPGTDTPVVYNPVTPATVQGQVTYIDDTTGKTITTDNFSGKVGEKISYTTAGKIAELTSQGYELVSNNFSDGNETFTDGNNSFEVHVKHAAGTVTPTNPHGDEEETNTKTEHKATTFTVHYVGAGENNPADHVETIQWTRQVTTNADGKVVSTTPWTTAGNYTSVNTPVVNGYHADKAAVEAPQADPDRDSEATVTYAPNGHIIPVDRTNTPIPGADHPQYPTDPSDPTKVVPNEPVPTIPGYVPEQETVTPVDPGSDTPVVYDHGTTPVAPETPVTPEPTPEEPATPATPETPAANDGQQDEKVTPSSSTTPTETVKVTSTTEEHVAQPAVKKATPEQAKVKTLPQTGNEAENSAEILGLAALGLTGLLAAGKKRRKED